MKITLAQLRRVYEFAFETAFAAGQRRDAAVVDVVKLRHGGVFAGDILAVGDVAEKQDELVEQGMVIVKRDALVKHRTVLVQHKQVGAVAVGFVKQLDFVGFVFLQHHGQYGLQ